MADAKGWKQAPNLQANHGLVDFRIPGSAGVGSSEALWHPDSNQQKLDFLGSAERGLHWFGTPLLITGGRRARALDTDPPPPPPKQEQKCWLSALTGHDS